MFVSDNDKKNTIAVEYMSSKDFFFDDRTAWSRRRRIDCKTRAEVEVALDGVRTKYDVLLPPSDLPRLRLREEAQLVTHLLGHLVLFTKVWQR